VSPRKPRVPKKQQKIARTPGRSVGRAKGRSRGPAVPAKGYLNPRSYYWGLRKQLKRLTKYFDPVPRFFEAGEQIARPGLPLPGAYYLESGFVQANDDSDVTLATRGLVYEPGDSFGEYALEGRHDAAFPAYLRALTPVHAWFISPPRFAEAKKNEGRAIQALVQKVQSRVRLNQYLPELIAALSESAQAQDVPKHRIVDEAQLGAVLELKPEITLTSALTKIGRYRARDNRGPRRDLPQWFYVAEGAVHAKGVVLPKGSVFLWSASTGPNLRGGPSPPTGASVQGESVTRLVWLRRGLARYLRREDLERIVPALSKSPPLGRRAVMIGFRCERDSDRVRIPFSAIAALLAEALSKLPEVGSVGLWIVGPNGSKKRAPQTWGRVTIRYTTESHISGEQNPEDFVVIDAVDDAGWPADWIAWPGKVHPPLTKLVIIGTSPKRSALPLSGDGARRSEVRPDLVRAVVLRDDPTIGQFVAYQPGTVRLAFDDIDRLPSLVQSGHPRPTRDRLSIARLARSVAEMRVGLALGGGGAWGYAHIALIQELERVGIPIDLISGVSFGSLVAGFYAAGGAEELNTLIDKGQMLKWYLELSAALPVPNLAHKAIDMLLGCQRLEFLETPFFPVGLNLNTAEEWTVGLGTVGYGTRAASALPGLLPPLVDIDQKLRLVDGAFVNNVPEGILLRERADVILASDVVETPPRRRETRWSSLTSFLDPRSRMEDSFRATAVLMQAANDRDRSLAMDTFRPPATEFSALAFDKAWEITEGAREAAARFARSILQRYRPGPLIRTGAPEDATP